METVDLISAWRIWARGEPTNSFQLWWWSILWWGRIGKLLAAAGIFGFALEIIGHKRIESFGFWLKTSISIEFGTFREDLERWALLLFERVYSALEPLISPWDLIWPSRSKSTERHIDLAPPPTRYGISGLGSPSVAGAVGQPANTDSPDKPGLIQIIRQRPFAALLWFTISTTASLGLIIWWPRLLGEDLFATWILLMVIGGVYAILGPVATWLVSVALVILVIAFDQAVVKPIASLIANPKTNTWIRLAIFLSTVIGFHFDLLAS